MGLVAIACAAAALAPAAAHAAATTLQPQPGGARTFAASDGGWTVDITRTGSLTCSGLLHVPGVTCPQVTTGWQGAGGADGAGDGHLRASVTTLAGLLSTTTIDWTSPAFTVAAAPDVASFGLKLRGSVASLGVGGRATVEATLVDLTDGARTSALLSSTAVTDSSGFVSYGGSIPPGTLTPGDQTQIRVRLAIATPVSLAVSGSVDLDDVVLSLVDLAPPTALTASVVSDGSGTRASGSVDPHGLATTVTIDYGPTDAYGSSSSTVVAGSGPQSFSIPLAGLTPSATYHYRVRAASADGEDAVADDTFTAPGTPGSDGGPVVVGAGNTRNRTAVFDLDGTVAAAAVEVLDGSDAVLDTFQDGDLDGSVAITLPASDGLYEVRVVRTRAGGDTASLATTVTLDRAAPDLAGTAVAVAPWSGSEVARALTVLGAPGDAASVTAQLLDASDDPVGAPVPVVGGAAALTLPAALGTYRVRATFTDAAGNASEITSADVTLVAAGTSGGGGGGGDGGGAGGGAPGGGASAGGAATAGTAACRGARVACTRRAVVGRIARRQVRVAGRRVTIVARVPRVVVGASVLRFRAKAARGGSLARVSYRLHGRAVRVRYGAVALTSLQLAEHGRQTLVVRLVPHRGRAVVVRIPFRTRAA